MPVSIPRSTKSTRDTFWRTYLLVPSCPSGLGLWSSISRSSVWRLREEGTMADVASPGTAPQLWQGPHPPGPKGLPLVGHLLDIRRHPLSFFSACCQQYGNIVSLRFGTWPALLLSGPSDLETVLVKAADRFKKNTFFWRH